MTQESPKVSIIIPFYNCPYIDKAIESAIRQTYPNKEIIVVNDGSNTFLDKINPFLGEITLLHKPNGGTASALNTGIKRCSGAYFAWLSSDDQFLPEKLEIQIKHMIEKGSKASFTSFYTMDENGLVTSGPIRQHDHDDLLLLKKLRSHCPINGCTVILSKDVFAGCGLFNEALSYTQDYEFWIRTALQYSFSYIDVPLTKYRVHNSMGTRRFRKGLRHEIRQVKAMFKGKLNEAIAGRKA
ncbi:glycosyltransferase involved in cell wall biosynthesis [Peribacillus deserti]|uniref:Glycosyltransferase involved in cell wall biosynthesis n=1 Tax=Peribacillus deserti TaxID=673318 RepID=A0ABS2QIM0_9BACI|nr:glycosyltransferase [Peribacillus deserti]MBM7693016.1 glycosyltransferase involved in cell wall biosynthesis [Peribacillus deserti]